MVSEVCPKKEAMATEGLHKVVTHTGNQGETIMSCHDCKCAMLQRGRCVLVLMTGVMFASPQASQLPSLKHPPPPAGHPSCTCGAAPASVSHHPGALTPHEPRDTASGAGCPAPRPSGQCRGSGNGSVIGMGTQTRHTSGSELL
jgi:hypothetical protein